jgi:hypothetical protein
MLLLLLTCCQRDRRHAIAAISMCGIANRCLQRAEQNGALIFTQVVR